jgi:hypothetical protein
LTANQMQVKFLEGGITAWRQFTDEQ